MSSVDAEVKSTPSRPMASKESDCSGYLITNLNEMKVLQWMCVFVGPVVCIDANQVLSFIKNMDISIFRADMFCTLILSAPRGDTDKQ